MMILLQILPVTHALAGMINIIVRVEIMILLHSLLQTNAVIVDGEEHHSHTLPLPTLNARSSTQAVRLLTLQT